MADTPDTRLTHELLVCACWSELTSDSDRLDVAPATALLNNVLRDTRDGAATFLDRMARSPDPLDASSDVELVVSGAEDGLGDDAMAAREGPGAVIRLITCVRGRTGCNKRDTRAGTERFGVTCC